MVGGNDDHDLFLRGGDGAEACLVAGLLDRFASGERNAVFLFRALFRLDRAALVFCKARQILDGDLVVDQHLDRSRAVQLLQRVHRLNDGQRAGVAQRIDLNHDTTSCKRNREINKAILMRFRRFCN